jgi:hypothetical protein
LRKKTWNSMIVVALSPLGMGIGLWPIVLPNLTGIPVWAGIFTVLMIIRSAF